MTRYEKCKQIVEKCQAKKIDGMLIDIMSASAYCQLYEAVKPENKELLENCDTAKAFRIVWDIAQSS